MIGLKRDGGGPCHINLEIGGIGAGDYSVKEIKAARQISYYDSTNEWPGLPEGKTAVFVGQHAVWSQELTDVVDAFCEIHNAFVMVDNTSNYRGKYGVLVPLILDQAENEFNVKAPDLDLVIHIGYVSHVTGIRAKKIWRVNEDGVMRDTFKSLRAVFKSDELNFFKHYATVQKSSDMSLYKEYQLKYNQLIESVPEMPFSNLWMAQQITKLLPSGSRLHLGIRNSLRSYDYFHVPADVNVFCNTGGFGIDGGVSSLIGASMMHKDKLFYGVFGDLLFFYDMNSLGNRDINPNLRILVVNNGLGQEFKNYSCGASNFGEEIGRAHV